MSQYKTNHCLSIHDKFLLIENHFKDLSNNQNKKIIKCNSHYDLLKRPILKARKSLIINKAKESRKNPLDQIGNDDLILNNDKLIANINLDSLDDLSDNFSIDNNSENDKNNGELKHKKRSKSLSKERKKIINYQAITSKNNNKGKVKEKEKIKINNIKSLKKNKHLLQYNRFKNINQFINKSNDNKNNIKYNKMLMNPVNNKGISKIMNTISYHKLNMKTANNADKYNESISLTSGSRMGIKNRKVRSLPHFFQNKTNMHFPNKSTIKNKDK